MAARRRRKVSFKNNKKIGSFADIEFEIAAETELGRESHKFHAGIHYVEKGKGQPIIFVHGIGQSLYAWRESIDFFADNGYHVYAIDLPGYGYSSHPNIYYRAEENAIVLKAFMSALKIRSANFIGFSTGALSILYLVLRFPKLVKKMVLVSPGGPNEFYPFPLRFLTSRLGQFLFKLRFSAEGMEKILKDLYFDKPQVTTEIALQYYAPFENKNVRDTLIMSMLNFDDEFEQSDFRNIKNDTMVFSGANDPIHSVETAKLFASVPEADHVRLRNCGHFVNEEKPNRFNSEVLLFLKRRKVNNYFY